MASANRKRETGKIHDGKLYEARNHRLHITFEWICRIGIENSDEP